MNKKLVFGLTAAVITAVVVLYVLLDLVGFNPLAATILKIWALLSVTAAWKLTWVIGIIPAAALGVYVYKRVRSGDSYYATWDGVSVAATVLACVLFSVGVGIPFYGVAPMSFERRTHAVHHAGISQVLTVKESSTGPAFDARTPYVLAVKQLNSSAAASGYEIMNGWAFPLLGHTCGIAVPSRQENPIGGIRCIDGNRHVTTADFDGKVPNWRARWGSNRLADLVNDLVPQGRFIASDIYGYIEDGRPYMVVPVTKLTGGLNYRKVWAGSIVFGPDAKAKLVKNPENIPGPVTGESVADEVLDAINNRGTFRQSRAKRVGFDLPNGDGNVKHFLLSHEDGQGERLVTILTPQAAGSDLVSAILEIDPHKVVDGWPVATLHVLPQVKQGNQARQSINDVVELVRSRYGAAAQMKEAGYSIIEPTPTTPDNLLVSIASDRQVVARVEVNLIDRSSCVYLPSGELYECHAGNSKDLLTGSLKGLFSGGVIGGGGDVTEMSDADLAELLRQVADEFDDRAGESNDTEG